MFINTNVNLLQTYVAVTVLFIPVLECGVFARHVQHGGQQGDSGRIRCSCESDLHFISHTDISAHRSDALIFPDEMIPDSGSDRKEQKDKVGMKTGTDDSYSYIPAFQQDQSRN